MPGNVDLRTALDKAAKLEVSREYYGEEIEQLRFEFGHKITVLPHDYGPYRRNEPEPTCYGFAFGLANDPRYLQLVKAGRGGQKDVTVLLQAREPKILRRRLVHARVGDVVLYFSNDRVRHAGIVITPAERIRSKWGPAEVHEHELWEVPLSYGNTAVMYLRPSAERILKKWAA